MPGPLEKYSRQVLFPEIGEDGQARLIQSQVVIFGCGALGTVQADALCRAGVGSLRIVDRDFLEESNLQRQTLFSEDDVQKGLPKAVAAEQRLRQINSQVRVEGLVADVNYKNIDQFVEGTHCILDATDNFETRFLINDVAVKYSIPWIYGAAVGSYGLSMTVIPFETPCLRCIFESLPPAGISPTCDTAGVLAPIVNIIASIQVAEAIKILTGNSHCTNRKLISFDVWKNCWKEYEIANARSEGKCPACQLGRFEFLEGKEGSTVTTLCGRDSVQISQGGGNSLDFEQLAKRLRHWGTVHFNQFLLRFNLDHYEIAVFPDGRGIVKGTKDTKVARSLYAKYIGS
ncbi:MAG: thiamine biosynthesis protein ThiF [Acidobacteria bacterium]|nr:MAG: thiamine biosynthesis protein ThiF [Acidobacteriota bacterium]